MLKNHLFVTDRNNAKTRKRSDLKLDAVAGLCFLMKTIFTSATFSFAILKTPKSFSLQS